MRIEQSAAPWRLSHDGEIEVNDDLRKFRAAIDKPRRRFRGDFCERPVVNSDIGLAIEP
jgi:hypothetical protein